MKQRGRKSAEARTAVQSPAPPRPTMQPTRKLTAREQAWWNRYLAAAPLARPEHILTLMLLVAHSLNAEDRELEISKLRAKDKTPPDALLAALREETRFIMRLMRALRITLSSQRSDKQVVSKSRQPQRWEEMSDAERQFRIQEAINHRKESR